MVVLATTRWNSGRPFTHGLNLPANQSLTSLSSSSSASCVRVAYDLVASARWDRARRTGMQMHGQPQCSHLKSVSTSIALSLSREAVAHLYCTTGSSSAWSWRALSSTIRAAATLTGTITLTQARARATTDSYLLPWH